MAAAHYTYAYADMTKLIADNISVKANTSDILKLMEKRRRLPLELLFSALADRTRLRLIHLMADQEICVCYFVEVLDAPQPKISRHLAYLRRAGVVASRREGKWMHYRLTMPADPHAEEILKSTIDAMKRDKEMLRDMARLKQACRGPHSLVQVMGAPTPSSTESAL